MTCGRLLYNTQRTQLVKPKWQSDSECQSDSVGMMLNVMQVTVS